MSEDIREEEYDEVSNAPEGVPASAPDAGTSRSAKAGYAAGRAVAGAEAAAGGVVRWLGNKMSPPESENQETFDEYAWSTGRDAEISPEENEELFGVEGIEDNDAIELDGTSEHDDELGNVDELVNGSPQDEDPLSLKGVNEAVDSPETVDVITGEPHRKRRVRVMYNYGPRRLVRPSGMGYYQPPTIHEAGGR